MLAADKLLLRSTVKQRTIELREKELNLFNSNFSAVATQAALLAGFSMAFLEMSVHLHALHFNPLAKALLHLFSTVCVCANIFVVSIITFVSVWGSGKALRGRDGSMSMVVEGMNKERWLIFYTFGIGLLSLLIAVACSTWLLMQREVALLATMMLLATCYALVSNAIRIFKKFELQAGEVVRFNDFLKTLPKAEEEQDEMDEEEMAIDPKQAIF
ncbi:hypothetical protein AB1Y20_015362 [Prymnesium parvum]|uniref:Uncharacterized protein n=1 Tax=Prymnesium parvum TaxID=97485 RepID=A0AB34JCY1_PRYPA|mmetsp:Transcript_23092/g.57370  ORF Transcript_23092/g.57370 Transcript_23092/m.57370 type:complete len:215 (-) Transcript_23092:117-761(-)|eukprot:CAMPEP_0184378584 /NCGR_PEP_ID=MMETSP0007-20130409/3197_1 /TAXON_ID=97485 /ORGANISM="Prymnesium parvum, Strain Texoma1" /LENGTH=214 /DNA_ID=CAMNT_0026722935 /DNA_START=30 /DNA_END=674 /DNA_ORIENTATION=-